MEGEKGEGGREGETRFSLTKKKEKVMDDDRGERAREEIIEISPR